MLVQRLRVPEGVKDNPNPHELRVDAMQVSRVVARVVSDPKGDSIAEELLPRAADSESERRREALRGNLHARPQGASLGLPIRREAHEVLVDDRVAVHPEVRTDSPRAIGLEAAERRRKAQLLHQVGPDQEATGTERQQQRFQVAHLTVLARGSLGVASTSLQRRRARDASLRNAAELNSRSACGGFQRPRSATAWRVARSVSACVGWRPRPPYDC
mmetsp:Transcript_15783/g.60084  ORF Transcript_15783/g.60084 Transcript_15783/m.60084 type:complete len:216 (-) Transcript_15783:44-691(-)